MSNKKKTRSSALKSKVVLDAIRERKKINEIAKQYSLHPAQIHQWKHLALDRFEELFVDGRTRKKANESEISVEQLFEQIDRLQMELEWVKKNLPSSLEAKREMIDHDDCGISVRRQCELLGTPRSSAYYEPASESEENLLIMKHIDQQYLKTPFTVSVHEPMKHFPRMSTISI